MLMHKPDHTTLVGGVIQNIALKVEMNATLFSTVINGIYSDKISSPIREICTNAFDSHIAAGKAHVPFDVHLPSLWEQVFWVRDYGTSMSHEVIETLYSTMFASSKRDGNDQVGMLGLGKMSPFAYTSGFTVTCFKDGEERTYSCFLGEDGTPGIALLGRAPTTEPDGVKVSFPVRQNDVNTFRQKAQAVFLGFDVAPNVVNENYEPAQPVVLTKGTNWTVYERSTLPLPVGFYAKQGCVIYPIPYNWLKAEFPSVSPYMSMIVDFPIGQLSVATSRENLGMDEATIRNLKVGMGQVMNEITAQISADIAKEPSYYEACKALARISGTPLMGFAGTPKWNGLDVFLRFELHETETGKLEHCFFGEGADAQGKLLPYLKFRDSGYGATVDYDQLQEQVVVVEFEDCKRAVSRMRRFLLEQAEPGIAVHWLRMQRNQLAGWQARNGGKPIIDLDTIEPLTSPKAKPRGEDAPIPMRRMIVKNQRPYRHFDAEFWASEDVHPTEDMFIVQGNLKECYPTSNVYRGMSTNEFAAKCAKLRVAGVFDGNTSVFFVSATQAKRVKLTNVMERIREIVEQKFGTNVSLEEETWEYRKNRQIAQQLRGLKLTLPKDLADFAKFYPETQSTLTSDQVEVIKEWIPTARTRTADHVHADRRGKIFNTYPLLEITSGRETHLRHYLKLELKK